METNLQIEREWRIALEGQVEKANHQVSVGFLKMITFHIVRKQETPYVGNFAYSYEISSLNNNNRVTIKLYYDK